MGYFGLIYLFVVSNTLMQQRTLWNKAVRVQNQENCENERKIEIVNCN